MRFDGLFWRFCRRFAWMGLFLPAILAGCAGFGGGGDRLQVWAVPQDVVLFPETEPDLENDVFTNGEGRIRLAGAVNEVVAFQLALRSDTPVGVDAVTLDQLRHLNDTISADRSAVYRQVRVPVEDYPSWLLRLSPYNRQDRLYPDVLVPVKTSASAMPITLEPGRCEAFWVEVRIPSGTREGTYKSKLRVLSRSRIVGELDVELEVWPFALPQTRHLAILAGLDTGELLRHHMEVNGQPYTPGRLSFDDPAYEQAIGVLDGTVQLLHKHRCEVMLRDVQPLRKTGLDGRMQLDWTDYDRLVAGIVDGSAFEDRAAAVAWPVPLDENHPDPDAYGGRDSDGYAAMLVDYLRMCVGHFAERGWLDRHFVWVSPEGRTQSERYQRFERLARLLREADPRLKPVCTLPPQSMTSWGWQDDGFTDISSLVGIWAVPAYLADAESLAAQRQEGRSTWFNSDRPPFSGSLSMIASPTDIRALSWQAYRMGCDGLLCEAVNRWPADGQPTAQGSESCLIWPGKPYGVDGPVPSIRLKRLLRAAQDYEYLWLLERNRRPAIARRIAQDLCPWVGSAVYGEHFLDGRPGGWVRDPAAWSLVRRLMAQELTAAIVEPASAKATPLNEAAELERFEQQVEWTRFTQMVRDVRLAIEGVRVRRPASKADSAFELEVASSVVNFAPRPFNGRVDLADAPPGWALTESPKPIKALPPTGTAYRKLVVEADAFETNVEGAMPVHVALNDGDGERGMELSRLALLTSVELARPLTIDGRLDDWPLGAGNVAGDFLLVGGRVAPKQGIGRPDRPTQQTTAFVAHDDEFLYVAFHCQDDRIADRPVARDNFIRYDDLWPTADDLVEVVLDPSAAAKGPGDLLHIVVKSNGAVSAQRGVPCLSRIAPCVDWPTRIVAAVHDDPQARRWTVEIRIPLPSLGPCAEVFGINFGRYLPRLGEYASWSGAQRHLYSPTSLGNVRLPR